MVHPADNNVVRWADDHRVPWYYTRERGLPHPCLKIQFGHLTAYFCRGKLTRLWAHADQCFLDDMFRQLVTLFELCGRPRSVVWGHGGTLPIERRMLLDDPPPF